MFKHIVHCVCEMYVCVICLICFMWEDCYFKVKCVCVYFQYNLYTKHNQFNQPLTWEIFAIHRQCANIQM